MSKLSRLNLLNELLDETEEPKKGFFSWFATRIKASRRLFKIEIPKYYYHRGEMYAKFLDHELLDQGVELDYEFGLSQLIYVIYDDYIRLIQRGANMHNFAKHLMNRKRLIMQGTQNIRDWEQSSVYQFNAVERQHMSPALSPYLTDHTMTAGVMMEEDDIRDGEMIVRDIKRLYAEFDLILEEMIQIRYVEIIDSVIAGESGEMTKEIIKLMKTYELNKLKRC